MDNKFKKGHYLGHRESEGVLDGTVEVSEKVDGCFQYDQPVETDKGPIPIGFIVNQKLDVKVLSMNNNKKEYKKIVKYYKHVNTDNWVRIRYDYFGRKRYLLVTDNHHIFTTDGLKQVKDLKLDDKLISNRNELTAVQKQVILGSILGDGSLKNMNKTCNAYYSEVHGIKQELYLKWKMNILNEFIKSQEYYESRYDETRPYTTKYRIRSKSTHVLREFSFMYADGKKIIPVMKLNEYITPLSLAIWFMDDGSTKFSCKQKPRSVFHTQSLTELQVKTLRHILKGKFDIDSKQHNYKGWQIDLTTDGSDKLYKIISRYVIKNMEYKLPVEYRDNYIDIDVGINDAATCNILSIEKVDIKDKYKYDLEVEDNHNYFVKGIQVHNSNFSVYVNDSGELICRSRNRELIDGLQNEKMFRLVCEYAQLIHIETPFEPGYIYFGENMVKHTIDYGAIQQWIGYAVYDIEQEIYIDDWYEHFDERGIPRVKVLTLSNPTVEQLQQYLNHQSGWGTSNAIAEGIFLKNYGSQIFSKIVLDTFKEDNRKVFGDSEKKSSTSEKIAEQFCTSARILKGIYKLRDEYNIDVDMPMMKWLPLEVYEDMLQENVIAISKKYKDINFGKLRSVVSSKCAHELKSVIMEQYK